MEQAITVAAIVCQPSRKLFTVSPLNIYPTNARAQRERGQTPICGSTSKGPMGRTVITKALLVEFILKWWWKALLRDTHTVPSPRTHFWNGMTCSLDALQLVCSIHVSDNVGCTYFILIWIWTKHSHSLKHCIEYDWSIEWKSSSLERSNGI